MTKEKFTYTYRNAVRQSTKNPEFQKKIVLRFWQSIEKMEQIMLNINANMGQTHIWFKKVHTSILKIKSMGLYDYIKN